MTMTAHARIACSALAIVLTFIYLAAMDAPRANADMLTAIYGVLVVLLFAATRTPKRS